MRVSTICLLLIVLILIVLRLGYFVWETPAVALAPNLQALAIDGRMLKGSLAPEHLMGANMKIVKEGDHWKLDVPVAPMIDRARFYLDRVKAYDSELNTFRTYM